MSWLKRIFGQADASTPGGSPVTRRITVKNPLNIQSPRIGFFNLLGSVGQPLLDTDKAALGPLFTGVEESTTAPPVCSVLLIYASIDSTGSIAGSEYGLREIIRRSHAPIVIVASENDLKAYMLSAKRTGYGQANLVLTFQRRGEHFAHFFVELFTRMSRGVTMPVAWVQLAPQIPGAAQENSPGTLFLAEISHIVFS